MQLDLKQADDKGNHKAQLYHKAWNYKLEEKLNKLPAEELKSAAQTDQVLKDLRKGNLVPVTFNVDGNKQKMFLEANPKERSINVYDEAMNKQNQGIRKSTEKTQEVSQEKTNSQGADQRGAESKEAKAPSNGKDQAASMSVSNGGKAQEKNAEPEKKSKVSIEMAERSRPKKKGMSM
jgi:hypothetical protein